MLAIQNETGFWLKIKFTSAHFPWALLLPLSCFGVIFRGRESELNTGKWGGIATDPSPSHKGCGRAAGSRFWKPLFHLVKQGSESTIYLNMEVMSYLPMMKLECRPIEHPGNWSKGQKIEQNGPTQVLVQRREGEEYFILSVFEYFFCIMCLNLSEPQADFLRVHLNIFFLLSMFSGICDKYVLNTPCVTVVPCRGESLIQEK